MSAETAHPVSPCNLRAVKAYSSGRQHGNNSILDRNAITPKAVAPKRSRGAEGILNSIESKSILLSTSRLCQRESAITSLGVDLAARGRSLIGRVAGAVGPDTRRGEAGDAQASSRSRNKADGSAPPTTRRAPGVCRRRTALLVVDDALPSPPPRALPADARSLAHGLSGLLPRAARCSSP